jgi:hypothetical protein
MLNSHKRSLFLQTIAAKSENAWQMQKKIKTIPLVSICIVTYFIIRVVAAAQ